MAVTVVSLVSSPRGNTSKAWVDSTHSGWFQASALMMLVSETLNLTYGFPYAPFELKYSDVGSEYVTIERPGDYPLINFKSPKLTQVSFSFLVADRVSHGAVSVSDQITFLHSMVSKDAPIYFSGLGAATSDTERFSTGISVFRAWRVNDFSYDVRRVDAWGEPTQVECSITLIEDRNPDLVTRQLSKIVYTAAPITKATKTTKAKVPPDTTGLGWDQRALSIAKENAARLARRQALANVI